MANLIILVPHCGAVIKQRSEQHDVERSWCVDGELLVTADFYNKSKKGITYLLPWPLVPKVVFGLHFFTVCITEESVGVPKPSHSNDFIVDAPNTDEILPAKRDHNLWHLAFLSQK